MAKAGKKTTDTASRLYISSAGQLCLATSATIPANGTPVKRFLKDVISAGQYTHPIHGWSLDVTPERMDKWAGNFAKMRGNGVDVEVVKDHSLAAGDVVGYVTEMCRGGNPDFMSAYPEAKDPNRLYAVHEMRGDGIDLVGKCKNVSILVDKDFTDGKGNNYGEAITHSAVVQQPVAAGQGEFMALSRGGVKERVSLYVMGSEQEPKETSMFNLAQLREVLGAGEDLTEENALTRLSERLSASATEKQDLQKKLTNLETQVEDLKKGQKKAASTIDLDALDMLAEGAESKIDGLVAKAKITPAVATDLKALFIGAAGKRNVLALSRTAVEGATESLVKQLCAALDKNNPVELGTKTKTQSFSRQTPDEQPKNHDQKVTDSMVEMAGGAAKKN